MPCPASALPSGADPAEGEVARHGQDSPGAGFCAHEKAAVCRQCSTLRKRFSAPHVPLSTSRHDRQRPRGEVRRHLDPRQRSGTASALPSGAADDLSRVLFQFSFVNADGSTGSVRRDLRRRTRPPRIAGCRPPRSRRCPRRRPVLTPTAPLDELRQCGRDRVRTVPLGHESSSERHRLASHCRVELQTARAGSPAGE